jgi:glycosyltransferase involved in cell wall biosynthesis
MTPRTIWIVLPNCPPRTSGSATYAKMLFPYLLALPSVRSLIVITESGSGRTIERNGKCTILRVIPDSERFEGNRHLNRPWRIFSIALAQLVFSLFLTAAALRRKNDLIYFHDGYARAVVPFFIRLFNLDAVCDVRDNFFFPKALPVFSAMIACSLRLTSTLEHFVPAARISYIPVPLDITVLRRLASQAADGLPVVDNYILFVGRVVHGKGIYKLLGAYKRLCASIADPPPLIMAGKIMIADAPTLAASHPGVHFIGDLAWETIPAVIARARIVVLPSPAEGLPRAILEAIALGIPVLCPPGIAEFDRYCPQCVLPDLSVEAIAAALTHPPANFIAHTYPIEAHDAPACLEQTALVAGLLAH